MTSRKPSKPKKLWRPLNQTDAPSATELNDVVLKAINCSTRVSPAQRRTFAKMAYKVLNSVQPFRFLDLPPELRNRIYEMVLVHEGPCFIPGICNVRQVRDQGKNLKREGILRVCRQVRAEGLSVFYGCNVFEAHIHRADFSFFTGWLADIGDDNRQRLRNVKLTLQDRWTCGDALVELVCDLTQTSGIDKIDYAVNPDEWTERYARDFKDGKWVNENQPISKTTQMLSSALDTVKKLKSEQQVGEAEIQRVFQENLINAKLACTGCPVVPKTNPGPSGHCSHAELHEVFASRSTVLDCGFTLSSRYQDLMEGNGTWDDSDDDEDEHFGECEFCGHELEEYGW